MKISFISSGSTHVISRKRNSPPHTQSFPHVFLVKVWLVPLKCLKHGSTTTFILWQLSFNKEVATCITVLPIVLYFIFTLTSFLTTLCLYIDDGVHCDIVDQNHPNSWKIRCNDILLFPKMMFFLSPSKYLQKDVVKCMLHVGEQTLGLYLWWWSRNKKISPSKYLQKDVVKCMLHVWEQTLGLYL